MKIASLIRGDQVRVFGLPAVVEAQWWGKGLHHALFSFHFSGTSTPIALIPERVILHQGEEAHLEPA